MRSLIFIILSSISSASIGLLGRNINTIVRIFTKPKKAIAVVSLFISSFIQAAPISILLEGYVTSLDSIFSPLVSTGDTMTAKFIYDPGLASQPVMFDTNRFFYDSTLVEYEVSIGKVTASGVGGRSEVSNNYYDDSSNIIQDRFILQSAGGSTPLIPLLEGLFDVNRLSVSMTLYDYEDADALSSSLPLQTINFNSFDNALVSIQMEVAGGEFDWQPMFATVTSAQISPVPLPAGIYLFISGLVGLGFTKAKSRTGTSS